MKSYSLLLLLACWLVLLFVISSVTFATRGLKDSNQSANGSSQIADTATTQSISYSNHD